jgi:lipopolysaccharide export system protein LptC
MSAFHRLRDAWDRLSLYLPLILMGLLALGTYWLVRNTPVPPAPEGERRVAHEMDYFMRGFTVKTFDANGQLKTEVNGELARHYPDTETLEIEQVRVRSINPQGRVTVSTAKRAINNDAGTEVQLVGDAVVVREPFKLPGGKLLPRLEFRGEFLHIFVDEERVKSHLPVILTRGSDQFTGDTFAYDNLDQVADLQGRVKGVLMPGNAGTPPR